MPKQIAIIAGTRPEVIKMAPVYFALKEASGLEPIFVSTGQHRQMLDQAMAVFGIEADYDLNLMQPGQTLPDLTGRVIVAVTEFLQKVKPDAVLVQGDTTTVLAAAMAAFYERIPVGHVEAGLRTGNMLSPFPEEMNRRLTTPLARWNFCPTETSEANLLKEGVDSVSIHVTGNTVIDALLWVRRRVSKLEIGKRKWESGNNEEPSTKNQERPKRFVLVTGHRRESFGTGFENICRAIQKITERYPDVEVVYPVHLNPKVQEPVKRILGGNPRVKLIEPVGYEEFIALMDRCHFVLSDSGGVQEEAPSLGKPVLVMRDTTERPEGVTAGTCRLVGTDVEKILREASVLLEDEEEYRRRSELKNPYGDGKAAERIVEVLGKELC